MDDGVFLAFWHSYYLLIKNTTRHRSLLQDTGDEHQTQRTEQASISP